MQRSKTQMAGICIKESRRESERCLGTSSHWKRGEKETKTVLVGGCNKLRPENETFKKTECF